MLGSRNVQHEGQNKVPGVTQKRAKLAGIVPDFTLSISKWW